MEDICQAIGQAGSVIVYHDGQGHTFSRGSAQYAEIMAAWKAMTGKAFPMPAFGVSIDELTRKEMKRGDWVEFIFDRESECNGMPFEGLLFQVVPEYKGMNLVRRFGGKYEGRCFYLDLREGDMRDMYDVLGKI